MFDQDCPLCSNPNVNPCDNNDMECVCEVCNARFLIEFDADCVDGEYVDCSSVGSRICDPDPHTEYVFCLREAEPGTHVISEDVTYIRIQDEDPYLQNAWMNTRTGRTCHYSYLIKHGVFTPNTYESLRRRVAELIDHCKSIEIKVRKEVAEDILRKTTSDPK